MKPFFHVASQLLACTIPVLCLLSSCSKQTATAPEASSANDALTDQQVEIKIASLPFTDIVPFIGTLPVSRQNFANGKLWERIHNNPKFQANEPLSKAVRTNGSTNPYDYPPEEVVDANPGGSGVTVDFFKGGVPLTGLLPDQPPFSQDVEYTAIRNTLSFWHINVHDNVTVAFDPPSVAISPDPVAHFPAFMHSNSYVVSDVPGGLNPFTWSETDNMHYPSDFSSKSVKVISEQVIGNITFVGVPAQRIGVGVISIPLSYQ